MAIRLGTIVVNCADIEAMTDFWTAALDLTPNRRAPGDEFRSLRGALGSLSLQVADTPVTARDQMHLDLYSDDMHGDAQRLVELGARYVRETTDEDGSYIVLLDPEDNEFCVCTIPTT